MDSQFLEFWGNYLLAAAKGQKQLEDLGQWMRQGFNGFEELSAMFQKYYGLEPRRAKVSDSTPAWQNAAADFQKSFDDFITLFGGIPKDKYRQLEQKYVALQKKAADREETIKILRELLAEKGTYQDKTVKVIQDLAGKQAEAFRTLMKNMAAEARETHKEGS